MNVSELKKEIESDKAFVEKVADRIYKDTDDWEEIIPEPEWMDRMTEIADRYLNRFELAQKIADKRIQSKTPQLNENQQVVLEWLRDEYAKGICGHPIVTIYGLHDGYAGRATEEAYEDLTNVEECQVLQAFSQWVLEQEAE